MSKRQLTAAEMALIEKIVTTSLQNVLTASRLRVNVSNELDEQGQVQWTTSTAQEAMLPKA